MPDSSLSRITQVVLLLTSVVLVGVLGTIHFFLGPEFSFSIFFFLPILIVAWYIGAPAGIVFSFLCTAVWYAADMFSGYTYSSPYIPVWNTLARLGVFLLVTAMITVIKRNARLAVEHQLLAQKRATAIESSQKIIAIIAQNITKHNSSLLLWVAKQKDKGRHPPEIVEILCRKIGANLLALTDIYFGQPAAEVQLDQDELAALLQEKLSKLDQVDSIESQIDDEREQNKKTAKEAV